MTNPAKICKGQWPQVKMVDNKSQHERFPKIMHKMASGLRQKWKNVKKKIKQKKIGKPRPKPKRKANKDKFLLSGFGVVHGYCQCAVGPLNDGSK